MGIKKYFANKDTSIVSARDSFGNSGDQELGNTGASDVLEVYALYGRTGASAAVNEISRVLVAFDMSQIQADLTKTLYDLTLAKFYLRLFNAPHGESVPRRFTMQIFPLIREWVEGEGLDMNDYEDQGGACWLNAADGDTWALPGADYDLGGVKTYYFESGVEDLELDITDLVNEWLDGTRPNYGVLLKMSIEDIEFSYYTKRFFARKSHYFFSRPIIEARYEEDVTSFSTEGRDEVAGRKQFLFASPVASIADTTNRLYYYNFVRGVLKDVPGCDEFGNPLYVRIYNQTKDICLTGLTPLNATWVRTGVYAVDVFLVGDVATYSLLFDQWFIDLAATVKIYEGEIITNDVDTSGSSNVEIKEDYEKLYVVKIKDLQPQYRNDEVVRFRTFIREKDWKPNVYVSYTFDYGNMKSIIEQMYYKIVRLADETVVVNYSYLSSVDYSRVCFDKVSNYFDIDMALFEPEFAYVIMFAYKSGEKFIECPEIFKFRVTDVGLWDSLEG